jgi:hypothetical protein
MQRKIAADVGNIVFRARIQGKFVDRDIPHIVCGKEGAACDLRSGLD